MRRSQFGAPRRLCEFSTASSKVGNSRGVFGGSGSSSVAKSTKDNIGETKPSEFLPSESLLDAAGGLRSSASKQSSFVPSGGFFDAIENDPKEPLPIADGLLRRRSSSPTAVPTPQQRKHDTQKPRKKSSKFVLEDDFSFGLTTNTLGSYTKNSGSLSSTGDKGSKKEHHSGVELQSASIASASSSSAKDEGSKEEQDPGFESQSASISSATSSSAKDEGSKEDQEPGIESQSASISRRSFDTPIEESSLYCENNLTQPAKTQGSSEQLEPLIDDQCDNFSQSSNPLMYSRATSVEGEATAVDQKATRSFPAVVTESSTAKEEIAKTSIPEIPLTVDKMLQQLEEKRQCRPNQRILKRLYSLPAVIAIEALAEVIRVPNLYSVSGLLKSILDRMETSSKGAPKKRTKTIGGEVIPEHGKQQQDPREESSDKGQTRRPKITIKTKQGKVKSGEEADRQTSDEESISIPETDEEWVPAHEAPKRRRRPTRDQYSQADTGTDQPPKKIRKSVSGQFANDKPLKKVRKTAPKQSIQRKKKSKPTEEPEDKAKTKVQVPTLATTNFVFQDLKTGKRRKAYEGSTATVKKLKKYYNRNGRLKRKYTDTKEWKQFEGNIALNFSVHAKRKSLAQWAASQKYLLDTNLREWKAFSSAVSVKLIGSLETPENPDQAPDISLDESTSQCATTATGSTLDSSVSASMCTLKVGSNPDVGVGSTEDVDAMLRENFGHHEFRPGQKEAIVAVLAKEPTLLLLSTGWGKSLCYQLPALMLRDVGITLVISPLVSLMADQLSRLPKCLRGAALSGQQNRVQERQVMKAVRARLIDVLFVAPERLPTWNLADRYLPPIALACIDEAHCVSEWSHNFRPNYLRLHEFLVRGLGAQRLLAMTATATRQTIKSVCSILQIDTVVRSDCKFQMQDLLDQPTQPRVQRDNLTMCVHRVEGEAGHYGALLTVLRRKECQGKSTIIYCWRKATAEGVAKYIRQFSIGSVCAYHGDLTPDQRQIVQTSFMEGKTQIVVATMAFGMGLDKPDIRLVIHYNLPKSLENYIQETGRASRDGELGHCHLLLDQSDLKAMRWIESGSGGGTSDAGTVQKILRIAFSGDAKGPAKRFKQVEDPVSNNEELLTPITHVTFGEKEASLELNCPVAELHSVLAHLSLRANGYLKVFSSFPTLLKIRFFKSDVKQLKERDPFLRMLLGNAKVNSGVHKIETGDALARLGCEPSRLFSTLWQCSGEEYTVEKSDYGFLLSVVQTPPLEKQVAWANEISALARQTKDSAISKLDAAFVAFSRTAEAKESDRDKVLNEHLDSYFGAPPTVDSVELLAGGDDARSSLLRQALGDRFVERRRDGDDSEAAQRQAAMKGQVYAQVARLITSSTFQQHQSDVDSKARAISQIFAGIGSVAFPANKWKEHPCWGKFKDAMDFSLLNALVVESILELQDRMQKIASSKAAASASTMNQSQK